MKMDCIGKEGNRILKKIIILGSTGSVGGNALRVVQAHPDEFKVVGLSAHHDIDLFCEQIKKFGPEVVAVGGQISADGLREILGPDSKVKIETGTEGLCRTAAWPSGDLVVTAVVGASGLMPVLKAIESGKDIAIANKEPLVMAGRIITQKAREKGVQIIPVDSEHSAIFQCLLGRDRKDVRRILLTSSGGPFRNTPISDIENITPQQALNHPRWKMGPKITIDSSTMFNKGLEVIEATILFEVDIDKIQIVGHPEAIIHSMVEFVDGSVMAQLGPTDMRLPIQYALTYPASLPSELTPLDFVKLGQLNFAAPDMDKFPAIGLCYSAARADGTMPAVLNAANEEAVECFLSEKIKFTAIAGLVKQVMDKHAVVKDASLEDILEADKWARKEFAGLL